MRTSRLDAGAFGRRLRQLRRSRKMSQVELAQALSLSQRTVSNYETGTAWPSAPILIEMARILRVSTDQLLGLKPSASRSRADDGLSAVLRLAKTIHALPERDRRAILRMVSTATRATAASGG